MLAPNPPRKGRKSYALARERAHDSDIRGTEALDSRECVYMGVGVVLALMLAVLSVVYFTTKKCFKVIDNIQKV